MSRRNRMIYSNDLGVRRHPVRCVDIELSVPAESIEGLAGYKEMQALVRLHGDPVGQVRVPVTGSRCRALDVRKAVLKELTWPVLRHLMEDALAHGLPAEGWSMLDLPVVPHRVSPQRLPDVTVAVCTRDRTDDLAICLESLMRLDMPPLEVLVVDNAPQRIRRRRWS